jgi:hypothetical protein
LPATQGQRSEVGHRLVVSIDTFIFPHEEGGLDTTVKTPIHPLGHHFILK